jgi:hypothetical protein
MNNELVPYLYRHLTCWIVTLLHQGAENDLGKHAPAERFTILVQKGCTYVQKKQQEPCNSKPVTPAHKEWRARHTKSTW